MEGGECNVGNILVFDCGSGYCKVGYSGDEKPIIIIPTLVGRSKISTDKKVYIGNEVMTRRGILKISKPIENGEIRNWDDIILIYKHIFYNELNIMHGELKNYNIIFSESPTSPKENKDKLIDIMFNLFKINAIFIQSSAELSLYSSGRNGGIVVESGDGITHIVPIIEGKSITSGIRRLYLSGSDLNKYLTYLLTERNYDANTISSAEIVRKIKETLCYVVLDYNEEMTKSIELEKQFELPDGEILTIGNQLFKCTEPIFQASFLGTESLGFHQEVYNSIIKSSKNETNDYIRNELFNNVILCGGNMLFKGMKERFEKELISQSSKGTKINAIVPNDAIYSAWIGGSIISSLSTFQSMWILNNNK